MKTTTPILTHRLPALRTALPAARLWMSALAGIAALCTASLHKADASVLFSDNFNAPDNGSLDASDQTGRRGGIFGPNIQVRSSRVQHGILNNQLNFLTEPTGSGRIRFQDALALPTDIWWDFAAGTSGATILGDGGLLVEFDWIPADNTSDNWISLNIGFLGLVAGEPNVRVNHPETDFGILFRNAGGTQYFDNATAVTGNTFDVSLLAPRHVSMLYTFDSFADGTNVTASAFVDGVEVLDDQVFQWANNSGSLYLELGNLAAGTKIDNIVISSVPEPSTAGILGVACLGLVSRRRRRA